MLYRLAYFIKDVIKPFIVGFKLNKQNICKLKHVYKASGITGHESRYPAQGVLSSLALLTRSANTDRRISVRAAAATATSRQSIIIGLVI